jgi:DNA-binding MarR family transcriptional regulator
MGERMSELNLSVAGPVLRILLLGEGLDASGIDRKHVLDRVPDMGQPVPDLPDVLVAAGNAVGPELIDWLSAPLRAELPIVLVTDQEAADAAGTLLGHNVIAFLAPEDGPDALAGTLVAIEGRVGRVAEDSTLMRFGDSLGRMTGEPLPLAGRVEALRREAERVARALEEMITERDADGTPARPIDAQRIRTHIKARRMRERFFPAELFADPAWDILLDLAAAEREGRAVSVSSLCIAASVPTTTGLRWIKAMVDRGLLAREPDPDDARRAFIRMTPPTSGAMDSCLEACFNLPGL